MATIQSKVQKCLLHSRSCFWKCLQLSKMLVLHDCRKKNFLFFFPFSHQLRYLIFSSSSLHSINLRQPPGKPLILSEFVKPLAVRNDLETFYSSSETFPSPERYQLPHLHPDLRAWKCYEPRKGSKDLRLQKDFRSDKAEIRLR